MVLCSCRQPAILNSFSLQTTHLCFLFPSFSNNSQCPTFKRTVCLVQDLLHHPTITPELFYLHKPIISFPCNAGKCCKFHCPGLHPANLDGWFHMCSVPPLPARITARICLRESEQVSLFPRHSQLFYILKESLYKGQHLHCDSILLARGRGC